MKNIKHKKSGEIIKVTDQEADRLIKTGEYKFCSKSDAGFARRKQILKTMRGSK